MGKINYSNFETIEEIIKNIDFNYKEDAVQKLENLSTCWVEVVGKNLSKFSKVLSFSDDNILTIVCADSFVANELYLEKVKLLAMMREKANNMGIKIIDMNFNYKKWKDENGK